MENYHYKKLLLIRNWGWAGVGRNSGFLWNWGNVRGYEKKRHSARTRSLEQKFAFNFIKFHNRPQNFLTFPRTDLFRTNMNHSLKMKTLQFFRRIWKLKITTSQLLSDLLVSKFFILFILLRAPGSRDRIFPLETDHFYGYMPGIGIQKFPSAKSRIHLILFRDIPIFMPKIAIKTSYHHTYIIVIDNV